MIGADGDLRYRRILLKLSGEALLGDLPRAGAEPLVGELDGDGPAEARVDGAKDFAHTAFAEFAFHLIGSQARAGFQDGLLDVVDRRRGDKRTLDDHL